MTHQPITELEDRPLNLHNHSQEEEEEYLYDGEDDDNLDTLSLCDLPLNDAVQEPNSTHTSSYDQEDLFEFFTLPTNNDSEIIVSADQVISCGKLVPYKKQPITPKKFHSERFPSRAKQNIKHSPTTIASPTRHHQHAVKYAIVFGFGKNIPMEMGLSDIRKRQSRLTPKPLVPGEDHGGKLVVTGDGFGKQGKGKWRLMKSLFGSSRSSHYGSAWARSSFNCLSVV